MRLLFVALASACGSGCSDDYWNDVAGAIEERVLYEQPPSGIYENRWGEEYNVDTKGPAALTITNKDGLCLMFWRKKGGVGGDGIVKAQGKECDANHTTDQLDWRAEYSYKNPDIFLIYPPNITRNKDVNPVTIKYRGAT